MRLDNYRRLGDYIRQVDVRNKDLAVTRLLGVSISKDFIPSIANTIGTDMSTYKIVKSEQFAYGPVTSRNGDKVSIALLLNQFDAIISQAYIVFEICDKKQLLPQYLMMWFRRSEFDRYARFHSHGSAREIFDWDEMCDVRLPIPSIDKQRELVNKYEIISRRININKNLISKLEETAQALYRKYYIDSIDRKHLLKDGITGVIKDFCKEIVSGGTPNRSKKEYWNKKDYRWLKTGEVQNNVVVDTEEYISEAGLNNSSAKIVPRGTIVMAMYGGGTVSNVAYLDCETATNQACCNMICKSFEDAAYLYFYLRYNQDNIKRLANGGAQENLSQDLISNLPLEIIISQNEKRIFAQIFKNIVLLYREQKMQVELQTIILSTMY